MNLANLVCDANWAGTIFPHGLRWLPHKCRLLFGYEALCLQCIYIDPILITWEEWDDQLASDLAGNAFCSAHVAALCLLVLHLEAVMHAHVTRKAKRARERRTWASVFA